MRHGSFRGTPSVRSGSTVSNQSKLTKLSSFVAPGSFASVGDVQQQQQPPIGGGGGSLPRTPVRGQTPTGTPREAMKLSHQEVLSENSVLKARVNSLTEELRTTRDICARQHRVRRVATPGGRSGSPQQRARSSSSPHPQAAEMMAFVTYKDSDSQTKIKNHSSTPCQTLDTDYIDGGSDEVRRLKAEVLRSHAECASLQHALQQLRSSILGSERATDSTDAIEHARRESDARMQVLHSALNAANEEVTRHQEEIRALSIVANKSVAGSNSSSTPITYHKALQTDDPILSTSLPVTPGGGLAGLNDKKVEQQREEIASLGRALELTKAQLRQTRSDLTNSRNEGLIGGILPSRVQTENVGVMVDTAYDYEKLFRIYRRDFNPSAIEAMLIEAENAAARRSADENTKLAQMNATTEVTEDNFLDMKHALDNCRKDLVESHEKIDELHYALDLERRERAQFGSGSGGDGGPEARQATAEISFLCDTLAATRTELEMLQRKTAEAEGERDAAVASFSDLKARTQSMFDECQDITESTRRDTDQSISVLAGTIRQKDHEIHTLRAQVAALNRSLETSTTQREATQKEADSIKARVTALTSSMARLREDYNSQSSALREARSFAASFSNMALQSPRTGTSGGGASGSATPGSPAVNQRNNYNNNARSSSPSNRNKKSASSIQALAASLKNQDNRSGSLDNRGSPRGGAAAVVDDAVLAELKEEYEELKSCFLMLCPLVPNAETAREVAAGVVTGVDKLNSRITALEKEIKKKTVSLQTEKKDSIVLKEKIHTMQRKSDLADELTRRVEDKERTTEKAKRMLAVAHGDQEKTRREAEEKHTILEEELRHAKAQLAQAKQELTEGREMMVTLLREDETALLESEKIMKREKSESPF